MSLVLQLHLVMMSKYSKFGVDTFNTFWEMDYIKVFAWQKQWSSEHNLVETDELKKIMKNLFKIANSFSSEQTS